MALYSNIGMGFIRKSTTALTPKKFSKNGSGKPLSSGKVHYSTSLQKWRESEEATFLMYSGERIKRRINKWQ